MPTYAYRWADGTVSLCNAPNKDSAMYLFDEVGPVSRKLIIRLKSPIMFTVKLEIDGWHIVAPALGEQLNLEVLGKCYPQYNKMLGKCTLYSNTGGYANKDRKKLEEALLKDVKEVGEQMKRTPETPDIVLFYPKGMPGQKN